MGAWYLTAVVIGYCRAKGIPLSGASVDVHKCFDQPVETLAYKILQEVGSPAGVLQAYINFQEQLTTRFGMGNAVGEAHSHRCGIPQGCPTSMIVIALMMRPWCQMTKQDKVTPRALADYLLLTTQGDTHATLLATPGSHTRVSYGHGRDTRGFEVHHFVY